MVAIDERTAERLGNIQLDHLKQQVGLLFQRVENFSDDLHTLESILKELGANFRVFSTNVILKNAKWSREQEE
jgi:uncharacterized protein (TIGR02599 family)